MFNLRISLLRLLYLLCLASLRPTPSLATDSIEFDRVIAPLLSRHCLECHNANDRKGKLDLTASSNVLRKEKPILTPGKPDESPLWQRVHDDEMPPKKPLSAQEKLALKSWIEQGAKWGKVDPLNRYARSTDTHAGADWWSLQSVKRPAIPEIKAKAWIKNPIDAFILDRLEAQGISPAPAASRQLLIRRVYFDLIGLPPTPAEIDQFVNDQDPRAYENLLDRLLESPHYGERWARHWLDVARYTESQGFEYDRIRPHAWHYRDYVIRSFNHDKPYNLFVQEQLAGDVMNFASPSAEVTSDGIVATSLLVCGPWDQAGNSQANLTQKKVTREEELEDLVSVVGQTFLGMTINCARCHSHKYDPISHEDYYRFKSIFEGIRHGERAIATPSEQAARIKKLESMNHAVDETRKEIHQLEQKARQLAVAKLQPARTSPSQTLANSAIARWSFEENAQDKIGTMHGELVGGAVLRNGRLQVNGNNQYLRTAPLSKELREKTLEAWVALSTLQQGGGGVITIESRNGITFDSIVFGERQPKMWIAGSTGFARTKDLQAPQETLSAPDPVHVAVTYALDNSIKLYRNGKQYGETYNRDSLQVFQAGDARILLGLRHTGGGNASLQGEIQSATLYDRALSSTEIADSFAAGPHGGPYVNHEQILAEMTEDQRGQRNALIQQLTELRKQIQNFPPMEVSYVGLRQQPEPTRRLLRGDVSTPAEVVSPGPLSIINLPGQLIELKPDAPESERRIKLAQWMTDPRHPLTARVMVNRLWHYHFGRGLVETPNDFGFNGTRPSHPELLDWLASEFTESKPAWSIKRMHKLLMMSATYQQSSQFNQQAADLDGDNTLLWRYKPRRLEGEIIRDAMLAVSGQLNRKLGGPSFKPFVIHNFNSDFYENRDMIGPEYNRRSIYRIHVNSGKSALMDSLDCPDPSIKTPARRVTTTPLAALALMNNSFVQRQAQQLAERLTRESQGNMQDRITLAYSIALGRTATTQELQVASQLVTKHDLTTLCWALLNSSEFLYVK